MSDGPGARATGEEVEVNLLCLNPEQMIPYLEGPDAPASGRGTVGVWSWEVDMLPPGWREAADVSMSSGPIHVLRPTDRGRARRSGLAFPPPISEPVLRAAPSVILPQGLACW